jgi:hypothetical protein
MIETKGLPDLTTPNLNNVLDITNQSLAVAVVPVLF